MATVPGIDVSYWDSGIDWPKVRATGQRFSFMKATEGDTFKDSTFDENWTEAKTAGLLRGAYHFFHPNIDAKAQANNFIGYVKSMNDNGELPPVLDLEAHDNQPKDKIIATAKVWLDLVEAAFGKKPIIYSGQYFLQDYFSMPGGGPPPWAKDYPLWEAQYPGGYSEGMQPVLPRGWFAWTFWQYSDKGQVNGINAAVDMNVFNGTIDDLFKFAGSKQPVTIATEKRPATHKVAAGDSFESIANKYGITLRELIGANAHLIKVGDDLKLPVVEQPIAQPTNPVVASPKTYTVKSGDTLYAIAIKHGTTVAAIASKNNIADINRIAVGQVLQIP